jgi:hypothetical protein
MNLLVNLEFIALSSKASAPQASKYNKLESTGHLSVDSMLSTKKLLLHKWQTDNLLTDLLVP